MLLELLLQTHSFSLDICLTHSSFQVSQHSLTLISISATQWDHARDYPPQFGKCFKQIIEFTLSVSFSLGLHFYVAYGLVSENTGPIHCPCFQIFIILGKLSCMTARAEFCVFLFSIIFVIYWFFDFTHCFYKHFIHSYLMFHFWSFQYLKSLRIQIRGLLFLLFQSLWLVLFNLNLWIF